MELNFEKEINLERNNQEYSDIYSKLYNSKIIKPESESGNLLVPSKKLSEKILGFQNEDKNEINLFLEYKDYDFYLSSTNYAYLTNDIFNNLKKKYFKDEYILNLKNSYSKVNLILKDNNNKNIGGYSSIEKMVELSYEDNIKFKYDIAEQIGYIKQISSFWRQTLGDGNCYYRSVIFNWFENIIFENRLEEFIFIIHRIDSHFNENNKYLKDLPDIIKKSITTIDKYLVINIFLYMIELLTKNEIESAYDILLKSFNFSSSFDNCMTMYFRYEIYLFIIQNQEKYYSEDFPVKLGNLLPSQYEKEDGSFLFQLFYENEILKQYTYAEKISIYVTPFIIKQNIKLLIYDYGVNCNIQTKEFSCHLKSKHTINLLYRKCHYDIVYSNEFSLKWNYYLNKYLVKDKLNVVNQDLIKYYEENEVKEINPNESKIFDKNLKIKSKTNVEFKNLKEIKIIENEIKILKEKLKNEELYQNSLPKISESSYNNIKDELSISCCVCRIKINDKSKYLPLPCLNCKVCNNITCSSEYFSFIINKIDLKSKKYQIQIICICGNIIKLKSLKEYCIVNHNEKLHSQLKMYYLNLFNYRCMFCNSHYSEETKKTFIKINSFNFIKFFGEEIFHWKCRNCKIIPNDILECDLCEEIHY